MKKIKSIFTITLFAFFVALSLSFQAQVNVNDIVTKDVTLKNTDGESYSINSLTDNKAIVIIFDSNVCPFSKAYNSRIKNIHSKYNKEGVQLVLINSNDAVKSPGDSYEKMVEYAKSHEYDFPYLKDENQEVAKYFGATNTPQVFVLTPSEEGFKVRYKGTIDNNYKDADKADKPYVENAINDILGGKDVAVTDTKAIGCTIKWK